VKGSSTDVALSETPLPLHPYWLLLLLASSAHILVHVVILMLILIDGDGLCLSGQFPAWDKEMGQKMELLV
jgi:hypothetical protein